MDCGPLQAEAPDQLGTPFTIGSVRVQPWSPRQTDCRMVFLTAYWLTACTVPLPGRVPIQLAWDQEEAEPHWAAKFTTGMVLRQP